MTKEIIIDGVNVAGCQYYDDEFCCYNDIPAFRCETKPDCYYKQLKRYKNFVAIVEENKKLLHTLQEIKKIAEEWMNNDWSCFHCRSNMDEKLKEILDLITKAGEE